MLLNTVLSFVVLVVKEILFIVHKASTNNIMISIAKMMLRMITTIDKPEIVTEHVPQFGRSSGDSTTIGVDVVVMTDVGVVATSLFIEDFVTSTTIGVDVVVMTNVGVVATDCSIDFVTSTEGIGVRGGLKINIYSS